MLTHKSVLAKVPSVVAEYDDYGVVSHSQSVELVHKLAEQSVNIAHTGVISCLDKAQEFLVVGGAYAGISVNLA